MKIGKSGNRHRLSWQSSLLVRKWIWEVMKNSIQCFLLLALVFTSMHSIFILYPSWITITTITVYLNEPGFSGGGSGTDDKLLTDAPPGAVVGFKDAGMRKETQKMQSLKQGLHTSTFP
jgi:hypothetical protein